MSAAKTTNTKLLSVPSTKRFLRTLEMGFYSLFAVALLGLLFYFLGVQPLRGAPDRTSIWISICLVCGGMLTMAIYNLSLRFFHHREKAALYFAIFCLGQTLRFFFMPGSIGWQLFPGLSGQFAILLFRQIPYVVSLAGLILFVYEIFGEGRSIRLKQALIAVTVTVSLAITAFGLDHSIWRAILGLPLVVLYATSCIVVIVKSAEFQRDRLSVLYLLGFILYAISGFFASTAISAAPYIVVVFNFIFAIIHSVLLSERFARTERELYESRRKAEALAAKTELYSQAIQNMDDFRRQAKEFLASVAQQQENPVLRIGSLELYLLTHRALLGGKDLMLQPKEFTLLHFFATRIGETISSQELYLEVWGQALMGDDRALRYQISQLRSKINNSGYAITNIRNEGYCFEQE